MRTTTVDRGSVRVRITLPAAEYRVFARAGRLVSQIMGPQAPTADAIVRAQLCGRRPVDIAENHLDAVGWPVQGAEQKSGR